MEGFNSKIFVECSISKEDKKRWFILSNINNTLLQFCKINWPLIRKLGMLSVNSPKHHNGLNLAGLKNLGGDNFETNGDDFKIFKSAKQTAQETYQLDLLFASP